MLQPDEIDLWLDPGNTRAEPFQSLLKTRVSQPLTVESVRSPNGLEAVGEAERIEVDGNEY